MTLATEKDFQDQSNLFPGERGYRIISKIMRFTRFDRVNRLYDHSAHMRGAEFAGGLLSEMGVDYLVGNAERLNVLPEGAFITISNHPYGGLDGVIIVNLMAAIRPAYKVMVNRMLSLVKAMGDNLISVTPTGDAKNGITSTSINGIRETLNHLRNGHPVGFFPSGAVSDLSLKEMRVRDREWQESVLRLIHRAKVPILPIRFFDGNSLFFYFLGLIDWRIRILRQPSELFNKGGKPHRVGIGNIISVLEQEQYADHKSFGAFLRRAVYEMPLPESYIRRSLLNFPQTELINHEKIKTG